MRKGIEGDGWKVEGRERGEGEARHRSRAERAAG